MLYPEPTNSTYQWNIFFKTNLTYAFFLILILLHRRRDIWFGFAVITLPLLVFYLITGINAFQRFLMPFFFVASATAFSRYAPIVGKLIGNNTYLLLLILGNFLGLDYAYQQWGLF